MNRLCLLLLWEHLTADCDVTYVEKNVSSQLSGKDANARLQRNKLKVTEDNLHEEGELSPKSDELPNNGHGNKAANQRTYEDGSDRSRFLFLSNYTCKYFGLFLSF